MVFIRKLLKIYKTYEVEIHYRRRVSGVPNWHNLRLWLHRLHQYGGAFALKLSPGPYRQMMTATVNSIFSVVAQLSDLPWDRVELVVEDLHQILIAGDDRWK